MIQTYNNLLFEKITFNNGELDSIIINDLIKQFSGERERLSGLWARYKGDVPILKKTVADYYKKNNKLVNNFRQEIIGQSVGYTFGNPIVYTFNKEKYSETDVKQIEDAITSFNKLNDVEKLDMETGEYSSVCGYGARLYYLDKDGLLRTMNLNPWEVIFVYDATIDKMVYALIYYQIEYYDAVKKTYEMRWKVELYDDKNVTFYFEYEKGKFELDPDEKTIPHMFKDVPVVKFSNNTLEQGEFEQCESLIDAYDLLLSNAQDETDEFRSAYLSVTGGQISEDDVKRARQTGVFQTPEGVSIQFITKELPTEFYNSQAKKLKDNIYNLSNTLDWTDPILQGNAESGVAKKIKFTQIESKVIMKERNFTKALYDQYNLLTDIWGMKRIPLIYWDMNFIFVRNTPIDFYYYGQAGQVLTNQISEETKLSLFPFIKDPVEELKRLKSEREESGALIDLENIAEPTGSI